MKAMFGMEGSGKEDSMDEEVKSSIDEGESEEDEGFMELAQGISISPKVMIGFLSAINKVLPLFNLPPIKTDAVTPELVRAIAMIAQAATDASSAEEIPLDLNFSMDDLKSGDQGVIIVAGKLDRISKTPGFRKFLKTPPSPSQMPPMGDKVAIQKVAEQSPDIEKLFASRM